MSEAIEDPESFIEKLVGLPLRSVRVAKIEPGDVIVVEAREELSQKQAEAAHQELSALWPKNKIVILDSGMRLKVAREFDDQEGRAAADAAHERAMAEPG